MRGRGDGLRGADRQAEDMAVPSAISEESLLCVPQDDLLKLKRNFNVARYRACSNGNKIQKRKKKNKNSSYIELLRINPESN